MNDVIIHAEGLSKLYKLYAKPQYRFLDMLGLLRRRDAYQEHWAIKDVNLTIRKGEKVAFIGRNGAGKSTLLRLFTGVTQPTSGIFHVSQGAHALLQIGTGFHPDFTGRENALAYLAHLAVIGAEARRKVDEIIAFSELEEYIDQPVKTYSSGMMARLMFATSTAITPELLVLDEILGVGDAYFANKSFERVRELSAENGTTVLLVSHDVYSAAKLCSRMIWMDRGSVLLDGRSDEVIRAYEHSVRLQEESRLRTKALAVRKAGSCLLELSPGGQAPSQGTILIKAVRLLDANGLVAHYPMLAGGDVFEPSSGFDTVDGAEGLRIMEQGTAVKRTRLVLDLTQEQISTAIGAGLKLEVDYYASNDNALVAELWHSQKCQFRGDLTLVAAGVPPEQASWATVGSSQEAAPRSLVQQPEIHGAGRIWLDEIMLCGADGEGRFVFQAGEPISVKCRYRVDERFDPLPTELLIALHRDGVTDIVRLTSAPIVASGQGAFYFEWPELQLGLGNYTLTVFAVRPGYFEHNDGRFFSINDDVYFAFNRGLEFSVQGDGGKFGGANIVSPMQFRVERDDQAPTGVLMNTKASHEA